MTERDAEADLETVKQYQMMNPGKRNLTMEILALHWITRCRSAEERLKGMEELHIICLDCHGSGESPLAGEKTCGWCKGTRWITVGDVLNRYTPHSATPKERSE